MKRKRLIKFIAVLAVLCMALNVGMPSEFVSASPKSSLEEQRDELQRKLIATEQKLAELGEQSRETEEYIDVLSEKIDYLTKQLELSKQEVSDIERKVNALENNIATNENEIASIGEEVTVLEKEIKTLNREFSGVYRDYCNRIRAIYISGQQGSAITFLLMSDGISELLTRYEMISAVSKRDGELLHEVQTQTAEIMEVKDKLDGKKEALTASQTKLRASKKQLKSERISLLKSQEEMQAKQAVIEAEQQAQNDILQKLHNQTKDYGEFRDLTQAELDEIDADIAAADKKYRDTTTTKKPTTTTTTTTTTKKPTTQDGDTETTTKKPTTTTTTKTTTSSSYINLTYPCPRYTTITCGFGAYQGHTGCDFSTHGNENQKIVASESGTVILVKLLERSYGHYIVIRHDKTTSSGKSVYTLYAHNNDIIVSEGDYVKRGQQIAYSGSTGNSTGPHCHFEVRVGGSSQSYAQNPANYLP